jgi:ABC-type Fe3+-hydroxamate transport system substrate-binding protein
MYKIFSNINIMEEIKSKYERICSKRSDINEHLPTLYKYSTECESIIELGVRRVVSSWAFVYGLLNNNKTKKMILLNDINECNIQELVEKTKDLNVEIKYEWKNDLELEIKENVDMVFIDTLHVYGQLKRELEKFSKVSNKYIIMHDTTVDEMEGEIRRMGRGLKYKKLMRKFIANTGFSEEELSKGLWPAITEFLENNPNWVLKERYTNNNGLTVLERKEENA